MCVILNMTLNSSNIPYVWKLKVLPFTKYMCLWSIIQTHTLTMLALMGMAFKQT
jgi:hypothetical protein